MVPSLSSPLLPSPSSKVSSPNCRTSPLLHAVPHAGGALLRLRPPGVLFLPQRHDGGRSRGGEGPAAALQLRARVYGMRGDDSRLLETPGMGDGIGAGGKVGACNVGGREWLFCLSDRIFHKILFSIADYLRLGCPLHRLGSQAATGGDQGGKGLLCGGKVHPVC